MAWERFPRAPIAEALLDIPRPLPIREERVRWQGHILVGPAVVQQAVARGPDGVLFRSVDERRIVQVRQDGYTFNWLKPHETWEAFRDEARTHWERYREAFRPGAVTRLGLRYINRLELPLPSQDFREFVTTAPDIAPGLPQGLNTFFMRLEIPHGERHLLAIITETMQAPLDEGRRLPFIFDIDIVREGALEPGAPVVWEAFEAMREYKNEIFFASMTSKAKDLFR
ncbi:MAG TPA: TIGR04255 family protein [Candidatus Tectomicrobia bacterium]|nr:TIGR04255 family protein [Candidatus Tectomicrobia bacterium]